MRVLQAGYGTIGREVFEDYRVLLAHSEDRYMVTDPAVPAPHGHEWDGLPVDVAVVLVDTPASVETRHSSFGDGFDYTALRDALRQYLAVADYVLVRSTVSLDFFELPIYRENVARIGLSPEFYGASKWNRRGIFEVPFAMYSDDVPASIVVRLTPEGTNAIVAPPRAVAMAKLADNAFLATKVTFFHELALAAERQGVDADDVRWLVTRDPRVGDSHTYMDEPGWQSHCFDKDVPAFARLGHHLAAASIEINRDHLLTLRAAQPVPTESDA